jgi:hypothetical protein
MSDAIDKKQKLIIEFLIADKEVFAKSVRIMKPEYFDKPLNRVVEFVIEYFMEYHGIPDIDVIDAETGVELKKRKIKQDSIQYTLDEVESFCKDSAMQNAILAGADMVAEGKLNAVSELVREALLVRLDNSVGIDIFDNPKERIENTDEDTDERMVGIPEFDRLINRVRRKEVGIVYGTTGAGKSVFLGNLGYLLSRQKLDVLIISLELKEELYAKRLDTIITGTDIAHHTENADEIDKFYKSHREEYGDIIVKFIKPESTVTDIRGVIIDYEIAFEKTPDVIIVDYLGLMGVENAKTENKFDLDEKKIFGLQNIATDYDAYLFTGGQLNRDGADIMEVTHRHVAGGLSAVNGSDWSVVMVASEEDMDNNQFQMKQLKIRNGARTMRPINMYRCPKSLRVSDQPTVGSVSSPVTRSSSKKDVKPTNTQKKLREHGSKNKVDKSAISDKLDQSSGKRKLNMLLKT